MESTLRTTAPRTRNQTGQRLSRFVFTLNNYTQEETDFLKAFPCTWMIFGKETGENGTPHLQGACILASRTAFSTLKTLTGFRRAHLETMRGKPEDSRVYCSKQDLQPFESGSLPSPGKRTDIHVAAERILAGATLKELAMDAEVGAVAIVKFHKGLTILRSLSRPDRTDFPTIFWLFGPTGIGKTKCCFLSGCKLAPGGADDVWISSGGLRWFDGYDGQSVVIFDDFRAKHVTSFAFLLRILDRYPVSVEFKGGFVKLNPSLIFITCPYDPDECFKTRKEHVPEDILQLKRRINESGGAIIHLKAGLTSTDGTCEFIEERVAERVSGRTPDAAAPSFGPHSIADDGWILGDTLGQ